MITSIAVLDVNISAIDYNVALEVINEWIVSKKKSFICVAAVHLIIECQKSKKLLTGVNRAGLITPDGMPIVWMLRLFGFPHVERIYGPTLMQKLCKLAREKKWKVFLVGGAKGESGELKRGLVRRFSGLQIVGNEDTPMRPVSSDQNQKIVNAINSVSPNIVFVGIGCPWQEQWMIENRNKLHASVLIGVGAAFDFLSGRVRQAPVWIQNLGLEWLFRLSQEPGRLWYRYLTSNTLFLFLTIGFLGKKVLRLLRKV